MFLKVTFSLWTHRGADNSVQKHENDVESHVLNPAGEVRSAAQDIFNFSNSLLSFKLRWRREKRQLIKIKSVLRICHPDVLPLLPLHVVILVFYRHIQEECSSLGRTPKCQHLLALMFMYVQIIFWLSFYVMFWQDHLHLSDQSPVQSEIQRL